MQPVATTASDRDEGQQDRTTQTHGDDCPTPIGPIQPRYGAGMPRARPGGTVTFLFTDIEDSTRRWDEDPSDMADALRVHDAILRGAIERHDGYVFGTGGDGFCAAFSTAADAAAAAVESQEELRDDSTVDFAVRMGLHTGEAIERDRNYFGSEVNRAARLMSIAHGGQVLVSDATEVLLRDRVALRPLGEHRLRGLRGRMSVYQVRRRRAPGRLPRAAQRRRADRQPARSS